MPRARVRGGRKAHNKRIKQREITIQKKLKEANEELWRRYYEAKQAADNKTNLNDAFTGTSK